MAAMPIPHDHPFVAQVETERKLRAELEERLAKAEWSVPRLILFFVAVFALWLGGIALAIYGFTD